MRFATIVTTIWTIILIEVDRTSCIVWEDVKCSTDLEQSVKDGPVAEMGRFPWLGVIQHTFRIAGENQFAVTSAILIHPSYVIAPADDIVKIPHEMIANTTKFIAWHSNERKYAIDVTDYVIHPEYTERVTFATIALVELTTYGETGIGGNPHAVLPACLPLAVAGTFETDLFVALITDVKNELQKNVYKVKLVDDKDCEDFYVQNELTAKMMTPTAATCVTLDREAPVCVWDAGTALITKRQFAHWTLIGFGSRGGGCGAPARFLSLSDYLPWINDIVSAGAAGETDQYLFEARRISPVELILYPENKKVDKKTGQCHRKTRGGMLYKDTFEVTATKSFAQGYYFIVIHQLALVSCVVVHFLDATARSNSAVWLEHDCRRDLAAEARGHGRFRDYKRDQCYLYFKSQMFLQFRFQFSFKADVEVMVFGRRETRRIQPDPFADSATTEVWTPTWDTFHGSYWYLKMWWRTGWQDI